MRRGFWRFESLPGFLTGRDGEGWQRGGSHAGHANAHGLVDAVLHGPRSFDSVAFPALESGFAKGGRAESQAQLQTDSGLWTRSRSRRTVDLWRKHKMLCVPNGCGPSHCGEIRGMSKAFRPLWQPLTVHKVKRCRGEKQQRYREAIPDTQEDPGGRFCNEHGAT